MYESTNMKAELCIQVFAMYGSADMKAWTMFPGVCYVWICCHDKLTYVSRCLLFMDLLTWKLTYVSRCMLCMDLLTWKLTYVSKCMLCMDLLTWKLTYVSRCLLCMELLTLWMVNTIMIRVYSSRDFSNTRAKYISQEKRKKLNQNMQNILKLLYRKLYY